MNCLPADYLHEMTSPHWFLTAETKFDLHLLQLLCDLLKFKVIDHLLKNIFRKVFEGCYPEFYIIKNSNSLDQNDAHYLVEPYLGPGCLQRLSARDTSLQVGRE